MHELLHAIVSRLAHPSEAAADELHAMVDAVVPPEAPADDATPDTPDTEPKGK